MNAKILSLLPGGDCGGLGGCGKDTCQACAEAIAAGGSVCMMEARPCVRRAARTQ